MAVPRRRTQRTRTISSSNPSKAAVSRTGRPCAAMKGCFCWVMVLLLFSIHQAYYSEHLKRKNLDSPAWLAVNGTGSNATLLDRLSQQSIGSAGVDPMETHPQPRGDPSIDADSHVSHVSFRESLLQLYQSTYAISSTNCIRQRGLHGKWIRNVTFGNTHQYVTLKQLSPQNQHFRKVLPRTESRRWRGRGPIDTERYYKKYIYNNSHIWRESTYYQWQDATCSDFSLITSQGFCDVLQRLNITYIMIVGDSMNKQLYEALLWNQHLTRVTPEGSIYDEVDYEWKCDTSNFTFEMRIVRDTMAPLETPENIDNITVPFLWANRNPLQLVDGYGQHTVFSFKGEWQKRYQQQRDRSGRTLLIGNGGPHYHTKFSFQLMFDKFVDTFLDNMASADDIVVWRETSAAHHECLNKTLWTGNKRGILSNYSQYREYYHWPMLGWDKFEHHNRYVEDVVVQRASIKRPVVPMFLLRTFNMSVYRPDAHLNINDCLHWALPGSPADYWVHGLYTLLLEIAADTS